MGVGAVEFDDAGSVRVPVLPVESVRLPGFEEFGGTQSAANDDPFNAPWRVDIPKTSDAKDGVTTGVVHLTVKRNPSNSNVSPLCAMRLALFRVR